MAADPQLVQYLKSYEAQGYDVNTLRTTLVKQGYSLQAVEEAITAVTQQAAVQAQPVPQPAKKPPSQLLLIIGAVAVVLIFVGVLGFLLIGGGEEEAETFEEFTFEDENPFEEPEPTPPVTQTTSPTVTQPSPPANVTPLFTQKPTQQPLEISMEADELKIQILRENNKIQDYKFDEEIEITITNGDNFSYTIENEGIVDRANKQVYGTYNGSDVLVQNNVVYTDHDGTWVKQSLRDEDDYFILNREIDLLKQSDIGILSEQPLEIITVLNKQVIGEALARILFTDRTDFFDDYVIDYEKALEIDVNYRINDDLFIQNIAYEARLEVNNDTVSPKNGISFDEDRVITKTVETEFRLFNAAKITVPSSIVTDSISISDYEDMLAEVNISDVPDINVTDTNVTDANITDNTTNSS